MRAATRQKGILRGKNVHRGITAGDESPFLPFLRCTQCSTQEDLGSFPLNKLAPIYANSNTAVFILNCTCEAQTPSLPIFIIKAHKLGLITWNYTQNLKGEIFSWDKPAQLPLRASPSYLAKWDKPRMCRDLLFFHLN